MSFSKVTTELVLAEFKFRPGMRVCAMDLSDLINRSQGDVNDSLVSLTNKGILAREKFGSCYFYAQVK